MFPQDKVPSHFQSVMNIRFGATDKMVAFIVIRREVMDRLLLVVHLSVGRHAMFTINGINLPMVVRHAFPQIVSEIFQMG